MDCKYFRFFIVLREWKGKSETGLSRHQKGAGSKLGTSFPFCRCPLTVSKGSQDYGGRAGAHWNPQVGSCRQERPSGRSQVFAFLWHFLCLGVVVFLTSAYICQPCCNDTPVGLNVRGCRRYLFKDGGVCHKGISPIRGSG